MSEVHLLLDQPRIRPVRPGIAVERPWLRIPTIPGRLRKLLPFLLIVVLPTLIVAAYGLFFAADQFVSEAHFVVRGPPAAAPATLTSLISSGGGRGDENTYAVQDYILSRDALGELQHDEQIEVIYHPPEADMLARFPLMNGLDTFEHLYAYYLRHVDVELDSTTGVSSLKVRTFRAADSYRVAMALMRVGERLVNRMNARQRENALADSRKEISLAEARVEDIAQRIAAFRNREALLDPNKQSIPMLQAVTELDAAMTRAKLQIAQLMASSPRSPLLPEYQARVAALQNKITEARSKITGDASSLVPKITAFDALSLQRDFADKQLSSATSSLEAARIQAGRQQVYLETIVQPNAPDYPAYPKQLSTVAICFATMLGVYVMAALLLAGVREHRLV